MADIYDGAFRTIVNDCKQFILPFINEVFGEHYDGSERIEFHPNEHFIDQQDKPDIKRITDTNLTVFGKQIKKYHLECESSIYSRKILIRLFEYAAQIALDESETGHDTIKVVFPHTSVLYLRNTTNTPDKMRVSIEVPGDKAEYDIPVVKMAAYSIDDIFDKKLYMLLPFYIFTYESGFDDYNNDDGKLSNLKAEYQSIIDKLNILVADGEMSGYDRRTIIELSNDVIQELTKKYENLQKEVGGLMRGEMIITDVHKAREEGRAEGEARGRTEGRIELCIKLIKDGLISIGDAAKNLCMSEDEIKKLMT